ncbi:hypothetical protein J0689_26895, partial [Vibrio parahaemolyticus]|uniref:hypothetical protein n=1 Tax=Vibrio parahaemolyticus TaxID=670 RepID=UPI001A8F4C32
SFLTVQYWLMLLTASIYPDILHLPLASMLVAQVLLRILVILPNFHLHANHCFVSEQQEIQLKHAVAMEHVSM